MPQPEHHVTNLSPAMPSLLEQPEMFVMRSHCTARGGMLRWFLPGVVAVLLVNAMRAYDLRGTSLTFCAIEEAVWTGIGLALVMAMRVQARSRTRERALITMVGDLAQLRRWSEAGEYLEAVLSRPMRSESMRVRALVLLSMLLSRYERREQALAVQESLFADPTVDPATALGLKLGRAVLLLREDRLFDADRAISDLRRVVGRLKGGSKGSADADSDAEAGTASNGSVEAAELPPEPNRAIADISSALALIEIYRDVKTGHPTDALDMYRSRLGDMTRGLGHGVADAHALAARALDLLGRGDEAAAAYQRATLLAPAAELHRKYSELDSMIGRFTPAAAPQPQLRRPARDAQSEGGLSAEFSAPADDRPVETDSSAQASTGLSSRDAIAALRRGWRLSMVLAVLIAALAVAIPVAFAAVPALGPYRIHLIPAGAVIAGLLLLVAGRRPQGVRAVAAAAAEQLLVAAAQARPTTNQEEVIERLISQRLLGRMTGDPARQLAFCELIFLRRVQRRWADVAALTQAMLSLRAAIGRGPLGAPLALLATEASLALGDVQAAFRWWRLTNQPRVPLVMHVRRLSLQLDLELRVNAWGSAARDLASRTELAELMPAGEAARAQATMALAAQRMGLGDWRDWLVGRAELLADPSGLCAAEPALSPLWMSRV